MPEGPTLVILKEETRHFESKKVLEAKGNAKIDLDRLLNKRVNSLQTWGKHFLISFDDFYLRVHFLMFGSYLIDADKQAKIRLGLRFANGTLNFYASNVKLIEGAVADDYDFSADVMSGKWSPQKARNKLKNEPSKMICDALLEQDIFSGVGNIIKNEVLYRVKVHPESLVGNIPSKKIGEIIKESRVHSFEFLEWKKESTLKKHWLAHTIKTCKRCKLPFDKAHTGTKKRRSFFCVNCQVRY